MHMTLGHVPNDGRSLVKILAQIARFVRASWLPEVKDVPGCPGNHWPMRNIRLGGVSASINHQRSSVVG